MKILISGATGFLGEYVIKELSLLKCELFLIVRDKHSILELVDEYPDLKFYFHDYLDREKVFISNDNFDVFLNLAWGDLDDFQSSRHLDFELPGQKRFLSEVISSGVKSVVSVGTCLEYADLQGELQEDAPCSSSIPYAIAKNHLREFLQTECRSQEIDFTWVRLFYFYGPGQQERTLFGQLSKAVELGEATFNATTDGQQMLDYMPVNDVAKSLIQIMLSGKSHGKVNICSGRARFLRDISIDWLRDFGWNIQITWGDQKPRSYESRPFWGSTKKLSEIVNVNQKAVIHHE